MTPIVTGLLGIALLVLFLGYYVVLLPFPPLVLIIVGVLVLAIADFVVTTRQELRNGRNDSRAS